jgi:acyl carrier protein
MSVRAQIEMTFRDVAGEQDKQIVTPLRDELGVLGVGLDSMCLAHIVARLEDELGVDPISDQGFPQTIGEFMTMYENAVSAKNATTGA